MESKEMGLEQKPPRLLVILDGLCLLLVLAAAGMVFFYAPLERVMGLVQKLFYFHVAVTWVGMLGFLAALAAAVGYLRTSDRKWDRAELAAVEIGLVFMLTGIVTGSIWARPVWNTWWTWDPRLTTSAIMVLVYAAYLMLRQGIEDPDRSARFGAVYAVVGFLSVPLTFLSIRLFRTIHPVLIGSGDPAAAGSFDMTAAMTQTFVFCLLVFTLVFADLLWHRVRLGALAEQVRQLKQKLDFGEGNHES